MDKFEITIGAGSDACWDIPQPLSLRLGKLCFTKLLRKGCNEADDYLQVPPIQLAFWLTDNWWRLRWEPAAVSEKCSNWRLAHELSSIGGGFIWPNMCIWGEETRVGFSSLSGTPSADYPIRFLTDGLVLLPAQIFEEAVDHFLNQAVDANSCDKTALQAQVLALNEERQDEDLAAWRRFEAKLGYDVDSAPENLIEALLELMKVYGNGVEEAIVAIQGELAASSLEEGINTAKYSRVVCNLDDAVSAAGAVDKEAPNPIWERAEDAAKAVRSNSGVEGGPLRNTRLADLLQVSKSVFTHTKFCGINLNYGLRLRGENGESNSVALASRWSHNRRFDLCRTLGDAVWSNNDPLGPMTKAKTERQKFQRAFAQSLLCPFDDLRAYVNTEKPSEDDIFAAARHFHVSENVIRTLFVNKEIIDRSRFDELVEAA